MDHCPKKPTHLRLLAGLERKNGWTLAEHAGAACPDGMQRLLRTAGWDVDGVRDDLRGYVLEALGDPSGVFIIDETGFLKKGVCSAGVQRQYTGTSGKIDNCQLGVFLAYGSARGRALIDRELYLPKSWIADPDRCAAAGIGEGAAFVTKPEQGVAMLARVHETGQLRGWVTADEAYGQNRGFPDWLAGHKVPFVLATRSDDLLSCTDGQRYEAKNLVARVRPCSWGQRSAGPGAHGNGSTTGLSQSLIPLVFPRIGGTGCWCDASSTPRRARNPSWRSTAARDRLRRRSLS